MQRERIWYARNLHSDLLLPLSWLFRSFVFIRRLYYSCLSNRNGLDNLFIIIVGNITVGGAGKTPFVEYLAQYLIQSGTSVGIVSRGYRRNHDGLQEVFVDSVVEEVGDEALMLKQNLDCPMAVAADRRQAACYLRDQYGVEVIISDDGLQHYNLPRDFEIVVVDSQREFGNARCLPAGPLREPVSRLKSVDLIISNGKHPAYEHDYTVTASYAVSIENCEQITLASWSGKTVHAVAGIGNPERFFAILKTEGIEVVPHPFADHHRYRRTDLDFNDDLPVLMTGKDAVKCRRFGIQNMWYVPITLIMNAKLDQRIHHLMEKIN